MRRYLEQEEVLEGGEEGEEVEGEDEGEAGHLQQLRVGEPAGGGGDHRPAAHLVAAWMPTPCMSMESPPM